MSNDNSALVFSFGKYKGRTLAELLATDPGYLQWIAAQGWFADRFAQLHAAVVSRGAAPDDTPEHNALQARFLDPNFKKALLISLYGLKYLTEEIEEQKGFNIKYGCGEELKKVKDRLEGAHREVKRLNDHLIWIQTNEL